MKNAVSFETASRLKAAGFPQPETVQEGQFWYSCIVRKTRERELRYINQFDRTGILPTEFFACYPYFAPTATDILAQLGDNYNLTICSQFFRVEQMKADEYFVINYWQSDNPAEAAALAWLEIHEKKAFTPNARIKFKREQTVECYDENGKQNLLVIGKGKEYDAILKDKNVTINSVFGPIELPKFQEAFSFEWL